MDTGYGTVDASEEGPCSGGNLSAPGQSDNGPLQRHEFSRIRMTAGPTGRPVQPFGWRSLAEILQEREKLRKERGVYLQRTQYLAKEQVYFQDLLREHHLCITVDYETQLQVMTQLLGHIKTHLSSLWRDDESAKSQLMRLQQEAMLLGHPSPEHPWASDADILIPDQEVEEIVPSSGTPHPQASPQEPPHHDAPRTDPQPPLTATVRSPPETQTGIIQSAEEVIGLTQDPLSSQTDEGSSSTQSSKAQTHSVRDKCNTHSVSWSVGDKCIVAWRRDKHERIEEQGDCRKQQVQQKMEAEQEHKHREQHNSKAYCMNLMLQDDGEKKTVCLQKPPDGSATFGSNMHQSTEERSEVNQASCVAPSPEEADTPEVISSEIIEGTVLSLPPKEQTSGLCLGSLKAVIRRVEKKLSFSADDVITKATMLVGDNVQFKISTNPKTKAERAVKVEILADTFDFMDTEEKRRIGVVSGLSQTLGYIKCSLCPRLLFELHEVMEEKELSILEKVEFTVVPKTVPRTGFKAIRVRRQKVFTSVRTQGASTTKQTEKKMTIKLNPKNRMQNNAKIHSDSPKKLKPQASHTLQEPPSSVSCSRRSLSLSNSSTRSRSHSRSSWDRRPDQHLSHCSSRREKGRECGSQERSYRDHSSCSWTSRSRSHTWSSSSSRSQSRSLDRRPYQYRNHCNSRGERRRGGESRERSSRYRRGHRSSSSSDQSRSRSWDRRHEQSRSHCSPRKVRRRGGSRKRSNRNRDRRSCSWSSCRSGSRGLGGRPEQCRSRCSSRGKRRKGDGSKERSFRDRRGRSVSRARYHRRRSKRRSVSRVRSYRSHSRRCSVSSARSNSSRSKRCSWTHYRSQSHSRSRSWSHSSSERGSKGRRDRGSQSQSREWSYRNKHSRGKEKSGDLNMDRDSGRHSNQRRNSSPECGDEERRRQVVLQETPKEYES